MINKSSQSASFFFQLPNRRRKTGDNWNMARSLIFQKCCHALSISRQVVRCVDEHEDRAGRKRPQTSLRLKPDLVTDGDKKMRFMIIRRADKETEAGIMPSQELLAAMGQFMEEMGKAGILLGGEGLHPTSKGARVNFSDGKPKVIDGPFAEAKELVGGYCLIEVKSRAEAIDWVRRWPVLDGHGNVEIEIRQVFEAEDFGAEFTPELREAEERLRADIATKV
jgi:hypothetical protein